ncbi:hypothetical protein BVC80_989g48 [Macleaya cordata]|uniref:Uncharacterized protein n=1 Tax=Macleaya cordata TaxID=56857 RepID=A0A200PS78_MACCD|nr:hypothetical protein BVC80_989g48 [Macleaya cordata]
MINGLHASGIISTLEKPSVLGYSATPIASNMVLEFFGRILEGIGQGVIVDNMVKGKTANNNNNNNTTRRTK